MFTPKNIKHDIQTVCLHHKTFDTKIYRLFVYNMKYLL